MLININLGILIIKYFKPKSCVIYAKKYFSQKDEAFWEEYTKRKAQGGRLPVLESQSIIQNKTIHSWKFAEKHALSAEELLGCLRELDPKEESPFIILDVREETEMEIYKLPMRTKVHFIYLERKVRRFLLFIEK
jgi:hypothetical protein